MKKILFSLAFFIATSAVGSEMTFGEIKAKYMDQPVRLSGRLLLGKLYDWYVVRRSDGSLTYNRYESLPSEFRSATGKVISIELGKKPDTTLDVFGKQIDQSRIKDPSIELIVRLDDGTEAGTVTVERALHGDNLQLVIEAEKNRKDIEAVLSPFAGKLVYLPMYQKVYPATTSLEALSQFSFSTLPLGFDSVPRATPLKIIETKYLDGLNRAIMRIALPKGEEGIMIGNTDHFNLKRNYKPTDLVRLGFLGDLSLKKFTTREISEIKEVGFFRGMSEEALYWSLGFPNKENDYGRGGVQLVFSTGRIIYLKNGRVADWQKL